MSWFGDKTMKQELLDAVESVFAGFPEATTREKIQAMLAVTEYVVDVEE